MKLGGGNGSIVKESCSDYGRGTNGEPGDSHLVAVAVRA
jgi:hypothetical protein